MATGSTARKYESQQTHYLVQSYDYDDITDESAETLGVIPAGSLVINAGVIVETAFNSATSDTLDIGTSADGNGFATLLDLTTAGVIQADELATSDDVVASSDTTITFEWNGTGTAPSAGRIHVFVEYLVPNYQEQ